MTIKSAFLRAIPCARLGQKFLRSRRGNIAPMVALLIAPLVAIMGVATQAGSWFLLQRAMQNAADTAVIAAATNGGNGGTDYVAEARSLTADYGFTNGSRSVTVTVPAPTTYAGVTSCASSPCYNVVINNVAPLYLLQLIGYTGNSSGGGGQIVTAGALATTLTINSPMCLLSLGSGDDTNGDGINHSSIGCNVFSNGNSPHCNGNALTTGWSDSVGPPQNSNKSCGVGLNGNVQQHGGLTAMADPYQPILAANPPTNPCSSYYSESDPLWPAATNKLNSDPGWDGSEKVLCGDVQLGGNVTLTGASTVLVIENGQLDTNGYTLQTAANAGLTIIFTSPTPATEAYSDSGYGAPSNFIVGGGTLDAAAPISGTWSGLLLIQNSALPLQSVDYKGNKPTLDMTGVIDAPALSLLAEGAVNKSTNGYSCFTLVVHDMTIKGTGDLFYINAQAQCPQAGVSTINAPAGVIGKLVY
jgi:Flp pilus assembly protein TadG